MQGTIWTKSLRAIVVVLLLLAVSAHAQGAPEQVNAALSDLSARLGYSVTLGDMAQWRWQQVTFADSALGCAGVQGSGGSVVGYSFALTYGGVLYDYRVSADGSSVILCSETDPVSAADSPQTGHVNSLCGDAPGGPYLRSRVNVGMDAVPLGASMNLVGYPAAHAPVLRQIVAGARIRINAGPDCVHGHVWWLTLVDNQTGYIAESAPEGYLVEPLPPDPLPARDAITPQLAPWLREFAVLRGNFLPEHSWSSDGRTLAVPGAAGSDSLWLYDMRQAVLRPQILAVAGQLSSLAVRPHVQQAIFGEEDGALSLWGYSAESALPSELLYLNAHGGAVSALAFSPNGRRLASAGPRAYTSFAAQRDYAAIVWDLPTVAQHAVLSGHTGLIRALAFSPDGTQVASGADDGTLRFWDAISGAARASVALGAAVVALDYSPDGRLVAVATARTAENLLLLDALTGAQIASLPLPTPGVTSLAFSPDSRLLAAAAAQGVFTVWDSARHELLYTGATDAAAQDISFSPDGTLLAVSEDRFALRLHGTPRGAG